jgi:hypothetical protein
VTTVPRWLLALTTWVSLAALLAGTLAGSAIGNP